MLVLGCSQAPVTLEDLTVPPAALPDWSQACFGEIDALFTELLDASARQREEVLAAVAEGDPRNARVQGRAATDRARGEKVRERLSTSGWTRAHYLLRRKTCNG